MCRHLSESSNHAKRRRGLCTFLTAVFFTPLGGEIQVEGIGYDFIPTVLDRTVADVWVKSNDKVSTVDIHMARARVYPIVPFASIAECLGYSRACPRGCRLKSRTSLYLGYRLPEILVISEYAVDVVD